MNAEEQKYAELLKIIEKYERDKKRSSECPACGNINLNAFDIPDDSTQVFQSKYYTDTLICSECHTIIAEYIYPQEFYFEYINKYYNFLPTINSIKVQIYSEWKYRNRISLLGDFTGDIKSVLEVSSFDGFTIANMHKDFGWDVTGVEPMTEIAQFSENHFPDIKGKVYSCTYEHFLTRHPKCRFDLTLFSFSFRQLFDMTFVMHHLADNVEDGKFVLIDEGTLTDDMHLSPNIEKKDIYKSGKNYLFSSGSLVYMFQRYGFEYINHLRNNSGKLRYTGMLFRKNLGTLPDKKRLLASKNIVGAVLGISG